MRLDSFFRARAFYVVPYYIFMCYNSVAVTFDWFPELSRFGKGVFQFQRVRSLSRVASQSISQLRYHYD